jgi:hypothetical protein
MTNQPRSWDADNIMKSKSKKKIWSSISNQPNIEEWNKKIN